MCCSGNRSHSREWAGFESAAQEIDTIICASIISLCIPMREWCFVAEHMATVDVMITYSTSCKSKTILEALLWFCSGRRFFAANRLSCLQT